VITPGEPFSITLEITEIKVNYVYFNFGIQANAIYGTPPDDPKGVKWGGKITNADGASWFSVDPKRNPAPLNETLSAEFPAGKNIGEHVAIRVGVTNGAVTTAYTYYIYEWKQTE
jgi:hypothetical protein